VSRIPDRDTFLLAVVFYGFSMIYSFFLWRRGFREHNRVTYCLLAAGAFFHTVAMFQRGFSFDRCPVNNLYEAITFVAWTIVAAYLVVGLWSRLRFLGAFASPVLFAIGVFALMPALDPPHGAKPDFGGGLVSLHASLILLSYGAFGLSSVAGLMYLTQEHDLKFHKLRAVFSLMPPIERLEKVMNRLLLGGFALLTAGLVLSPLLLKQRYNVYFISDPKLLWSIFVWALYLALLLLHGRFAQTGRRFAWGTIGSFIFVLLTFWGVNLLSPAHR
jgi:ABC-type transport system involved in cytochrome c biogenesis permease subunit